MTHEGSVPVALRRRCVLYSLVFCMFIALLYLLVGCSSKQETRLYNTFESPEALFRRALRALEEKDEAGLEALCITRFEHDSLIVPAMHKDSIDRALAWFMLHTNVQKGITFALNTYGGHHLEFQRVSFDTTEVYSPFILHRKPEVEVTEPATDDRFTITCFGTVVEENGHFKLVSIRD